jgi:hypothetical protein
VVQRNAWHASCLTDFGHGAESGVTQRLLHTVCRSLIFPFWTLSSIYVLILSEVLPQVSPLSRYCYFACLLARVGVG